MEEKKNQQPPTPPNVVEQAIDDVPLFKRKRVLLPFLILLAGVVAAVWYWFVLQSTVISTDDAFIEAYRISVSSKIPGRITSLPYDEGDSIHAGDTLVRLDDSDLRAQLAKAEASVAFFTRSSDVAVVTLAKAQEDFARAEKQFASQVIPQEQYSHTNNSLKLAKAQTNLATSQITTARADLGIITTQLGNTIITAPFSGVIAKRWILAGDVVAPGQAIYSVFDKHHIWITANFEETKLHEIVIGDKVSIKVDALPDTVFKGTVESIGQSTASQFSLIPAASASGNYTKITQRVPVKIALDASAAANSRLLPGLSASVRVMIRH
jgi:membrane fusion protein (multidrug efflux system)